MIIYLPCKIGEEFTRLKFKDWVNGKRIYEEGGSRTLRGFDAFDCTTRSLAIPTIHADKEFISYDHLGEFAQEFTPKYKISVDVKSEYKLSDRGFPSGKREQESRENTKVLKEIRAKAAEPKKKGVSLKDLIKAKAKKTEVADDSSN